MEEKETFCNGLGWDFGVAELPLITQYPEKLTEYLLPRLNRFEKALYYSCGDTTLRLNHLKTLAVHYAIEKDNLEKAYKSGDMELIDEGVKKDPTMGEIRYKTFRLKD